LYPFETEEDDTPTSKDMPEDTDSVNAGDTFDTSSITDKEDTETEGDSQSDSETSSDSETAMDSGDENVNSTDSDTDTVHDTETLFDTEDVAGSDTTTDYQGSDDTDTEDVTTDDAGTDSVDGSGTCNGEIFRVPLNENGDTVCAGALAERHFRFGLCTCNDVTVVGDLRVDSFDSSLASDVMFDNYGGAVGVNGQLSVSKEIVIGGSAVFSREEGLSFNANTSINGDLKSGGTVLFPRLFTVSVSRDAYIAGDLINVGTFNIARNLYLSGEVYDIAGLRVNGVRVSSSFDVAPPCPCEPEDILDVAGIIDAARVDNQNAENDISADALSFVIGPKNLVLECGRYYLDSIGGTGRITIHIHGPTALFVDGDIEVNLLGGLNLVLEEDAALDVFVAGNLRLDGFNDDWDMTRPSAVRFYVAGENNVSLSNISGFNLYAPHARVSISETNFGSIFAGNLVAMDDTTIHYDRDVLRAGQQCGDEDTDDDESCKPTGGSCVADEDCCEPLSCTQNTCQPLVIII
jgi:hypothetical protein